MPLPFPPATPTQKPQQTTPKGVYDGHGGKEVAEFAQQNLHRHFVSALAESVAAASHADALSAGQASALSSGSAFASCLPLEIDELSEAAAAAAAAAEDLGGGQAPDESSSCSPFSSRAPPTPPHHLRHTHPMQQHRGLAAAAAAGSSGDAGDLSGSCCGPPSPSGSSFYASERRGEAIGRALRQAFMRTDRDLAGTEVGELVGSTALVAVVGRGEVHLAHCGDSRAVLCRKGAAISLTSDHKPNRKDEAVRTGWVGVGLGKGWRGEPIQQGGRAAEISKCFVALPLTHNPPPPHSPTLQTPHPAPPRPCHAPTRRASRPLAGALCSRRAATG